MTHKESSRAIKSYQKPLKVIKTFKTSVSDIANSKFASRLGSTYSGLNLKFCLQEKLHVANQDYDAGKEQKSIFLLNTVMKM